MKPVVILASAPALPDAGRDEQILRTLHDHHVETCYEPLLTEEEQRFDARTAHYRHDADLLAQRFIDLAERLTQTHERRVACIGTSGAAAGALIAAAERPDLISAVVSIDGRTDLAIDHLRELTVPTLLIVHDLPVLLMNREALRKIRGPHRLEIVHGTTRLAATKCAHWLIETLVGTAVY
jgi:putative phosphoribosyl transferase